MLYKADIREYASQRMLRYFIPITIIATPLGQITGDRVSTDIVEAVGGVLVTFVAVFEIYQKRDFFAALFCRDFNKNVERNPDAQVRMETEGGSEHGSQDDDDDSICIEAIDNSDSIRIGGFDSLFDLDATVSENLL
jgi:hypothetical protein